MHFQPMNYPDECWIFGYGSLLWKVGFEFTESKKGYITGWARKFSQASEDHRGKISKSQS